MGTLVALAMVAASTSASAELRFSPTAPRLSLSRNPTAAPVQLVKAPPLRMPAVITLAFGAATLGASIFLGLRSLDLSRASRLHCDSGGCDGQGTALQNDSTHFQTASMVTGVAGGALLVAGGLMLVLGPKPGIPRLDNTTAGVRIVPGLGRVDLKGTF